jgi:hypothetical protein
VKHLRERAFYVFLKDEQPNGNALSGEDFSYARQGRKFSGSIPQSTNVSRPWPLTGLR